MLVNIPYMEHVRITKGSSSGTLSFMKGEGAPLSMKLIAYQFAPPLHTPHVVSIDLFP